MLWNKRKRQKTLPQQTLPQPLPCREGRIILICLSNFSLICIIYLLNVTTPRPTREGLGEGLLGEGLLGEGL